MSQMLKSSGTLASATLTSRILGMVREIVYAQFMGDTPVASAFKLAFQIPNLFRRLLGEGALSAAFIPIFKAKEKSENEQEMWRAANAVISGMVVAAAGIVALVILGISLALAARQFEANTRLMLELLRIMFPYMLVICLTAVLMGMLNARGHFFIPAAGALVLNLVMIASVLFLAPGGGKKIRGVPRHAGEGAELLDLRDTDCLGAARGAGRADHSVDRRARQVRRRVNATRLICAGVSGPRSRGVFDGDCAGARVLRAGRHRNADENQRGLSRIEPDLCVVADSAFPAGGTGH